MNEHFIKNIEIKNFKCFEDFKAEGFGRVNLIGGKNNVGKTAFMEAVYINVYSYKSENNSSMAIYDVVFNRYNQLILMELFKGQSKQYILQNIINEKSIKYNKAEVQSNIQKINIKFLLTDLKKRERRSFVKYFLGNIPISHDKLNEAYGRVLELGIEDEVDNAIKYIDSNFKSFRIINSQPKCNFINNQNFIDINELGDGLYKFLSVICAIYICRESYLCIDEIDNGIHYSNLDKLWEIILKVSKQQNVQVFATTHSKECIESYARVAKKLEDEDITFIDMGRNRDNEIKAITMNYKRFQEEIEMDNEVRGW